MPGRTGQLDLTRTVKLDANGRGVIQVGPGFNDEIWHVTSAGVACTGTNQSTAVGYLNTIGGTQIGGSFTGNFDNGPAQVDLLANQSVVFVWTGGDPGATATLSLYGTREW